MTEIPKPNLEDSVARLLQMDEYRVVIKHIHAMREGYLGELNIDCTPNKIMAIGGAAEAMDKLLLEIA